MTLRLGDAAEVERLRPGECAYLEADEAGLAGHPAWTSCLATGSASVRAVRGDGPRATRIEVRRAPGPTQAEPVPAGACGLCAHAGVAELVRLPEMRIGRCEACGCGMVVSFAPSDARPEAREYSSRYEDEATGGKAVECWSLLQRHLPGLSDVTSVLDIGCGTGGFLDIARGHGLRTAGVEVAQPAAKTAALKGHEVLCASAEEQVVSPGTGFDLVVMWDVLEHLAQPGIALANAVRALRPGGRLAVLTPMMGSAFDRWGVRLARLPCVHPGQLARMCWTRDHLYRFDRGGLEGVLRRMGCSDVQARDVLLLSLRADRYAGGGVLRSWTGVPLLDRAISRAGVGMVRMLRLSNKALVLGRRDPEPDPDAKPAELGRRSAS